MGTGRAFALTVRLAWLLAPVLAGIAAAPATAMQAREEPREAQEPIRTADDVIVTARRVAERAENVPVALSVLTSEDIETRAINTPLDLNKVAGLGGAPIGSLNSVNFTIRGQGAAFGGQQGVIPYFAEVPYFPLTYFDLDSIQVIKGPQGTLFGQSSTGGVVLFEPRRSQRALGAEGELQLGDRGYRQIEGALNLPLVSDRLIARIAFQIRDRDGWGRAVHADGSPSRDLNDIENRSIRVTVTWRPTQRFTNELIYAQDWLRNNGNLSPLYFADPRFLNPAVRNLVPASIPSLAAGFRFWTGYDAPAGQTFAQLLLAAKDRQLAVGPLTMFTDYSQRNRTVNHGVIDQATLSLGTLTLRNIFGLRWSKSEGATYDQDATALPLLDFQCRFAPGATSASSPCAQVGGWPDRTLTEELQLQGSGAGGRMQFQLGGFFLDGGTRRYREDTKPFIVFGSLSGDPASAAFCASVSVAPPCAALSRTRTRSYALYGQGTFEVLPRLRITAGYRRTWDRTRTETTGKQSYRVPFKGQLIALPVYGGVPAQGATSVETAVEPPSNGSYNLSVDFRPDDHLLLYAAHRSGYKAGGINGTANPGTPQRTYGPERSRDVELGVKAAWRSGPVTGSLNVAAYQTWYSDIQEGQIIPGTAQTVTTNLADARIRGVEIEGELKPATFLRLAGSVAFTDGRYTRWFERSTCTAQYWRPQCAGLPGTTEIGIDHAGGSLTIGGDRIGFRPDRFANASRWQWSLRPALLLGRWIGQDVELSANFYGRTAYVDATAVANSSKLAGVPPAPQLTVFGNVTADPYDAPGYGLIDVRLDWRRIAGSRLGLALGVTNAANKLYRVSSASAFEIIGDVYTLLGEPRMIYASARYSF